MWSSMTISLLGLALALALAAPAGAADPQLSRTRAGDGAKVVPLDEKPRPDAIRGPSAPGSRVGVPRTRAGERTGAVTGDLIRPRDGGASPARAPERPLVRKGLAGKSDPEKPKPAGKKGGGGGKKTPSPAATTPTRARAGSTPIRGGSIDPGSVRARAANVADSADPDEDEMVPFRPRPALRPLPR